MSNETFAINLLPVRVYYEDTDFSGLVYHASYLRFMERGRTEMLRSAGVDQSVLHQEEQGVFFAVRKMSLDYIKPARMDDNLLIETRIDDMRGASLMLKQRVLRVENHHNSSLKDGAAQDVLVIADVHIATLKAGKPARIPQALRARLQAL